MSETLDSIALSEVRLVGEYTNDHGPGLDDWFLVALTNKDWIEADIHSEPAKCFKERFEKHTGQSIVPRLYASTHWKSNTLWPPEFAGRPWFDIEFVKKPSLLSRLKTCIGIKEIQITLRAEIVDWISRQ